MTITADGDHDARWADGIATYKAVYGDDMVAPERGSMPFFDLMIEQLFAEVWSRPGLDIAQRRLLVIGVLAAQHRFDILPIQFDSALRLGELTPEQLREVVIQLVPYCGYPASGGLISAAEGAIAKAAKAAKATGATGAATAAAATPGAPGAADTAGAPQ